MLEIQTIHDIVSIILSSRTHIPTLPMCYRITVLYIDLNCLHYVCNQGLNNFFAHHPLWQVVFQRIKLHWPQF